MWVRNVGDLNPIFTGSVYKCKLSLSWKFAVVLCYHANLKNVIFFHFQKRYTQSVSQSIAILLIADKHITLDELNDRLVNFDYG